ncbi:hypothetical protein QNA24_25450 [Rhodococcus qingshengii]|nr:hypothetical protein [Rhodococcus qingshengii]MDJ0489729.1 hypothetical protein [Rhodococcus qingshengii]
MRRATASVRAADANAGAAGRGPRTSRDADSIRADKFVDLRI